MGDLSILVGKEGLAERSLSSLRRKINDGVIAVMPSLEAYHQQNGDKKAHILLIPANNCTAVYETAESGQEGWGHDLGYRVRCVAVHNSSNFTAPEDVRRELIAAIGDYLNQNSST